MLIKIHRKDDVMTKNNNAFKMTKAESDMRESSREMEQWLQPKTSSRKASSGRIASKGGDSGKMATDTLKATTDANTTKSSEWRAAPNKMSFKPSPNSMQEFKEPAGKAKREKPQKEDKNNVDIGDFGSWLGKNVIRGLAPSNEFVMSVVDFLAPTEFMGKYDFVSGARNYIIDQNKRNEKEAKELSKKMGGKGWDCAGDVVASVTGALPEMAIDVLTSGVSAAGSVAKAGMSAAKSGVGLFDDVADSLRIAFDSIRDIVKKPDFILSFGQNFGNEYNDALSNGVDESTASNTAFLNAIINSLAGHTDADIIAGLLKDRGYSKGVQTVGKMIDEGLFGTLQGMADASVSSFSNSDDVPIFSSDDENAIINPERMAEDFLGSAALGGLEDIINRYINPGSNDVSGSVSKPAVNKQEPKSLLSNIENVKTKVVDNLRINIGLYGVKRAMDKAVKEWGEYIEGLSDIEFEEYLKSLRNG